MAPRLWSTGLFDTGLWDGNPRATGSGGGPGGTSAHDPDRWWKSPAKKRRKASDTDTGAPSEAPLSVSDAERRAAEEAQAAALRLEAATITAAVMAELAEQERQQMLDDDALTILLLAA